MIDVLKLNNEIFTPVQDKVYDIFTDVAIFMEWVNVTTLNMGGLQTCKIFCSELILL